MAKSDDPQSQKENTQELQSKLMDVENQLKRAVADYLNLEKRIQQDSLSVVDYAKSELIRKMLPVLDSLDQAVEGASQSEANSSWLKGVMMSIKQLRQVLSEEGLLEIPTEGQFDPIFHEAVDVAEGEDNQIVRVVLRGYTLNGKIVRPAKVVVGKKGEQ